MSLIWPCVTNELPLTIKNMYIFIVCWVFLTLRSSTIITITVFHQLPWYDNIAVRIMSHVYPKFHTQPTKLWNCIHKLQIILTISSNFHTRGSRPSKALFLKKKFSFYTWFQIQLTRSTPLTLFNLHLMPRVSFLMD